MFFAVSDSSYKMSNMEDIKPYLNITFTQKLTEYVDEKWQTTETTRYLHTCNATDFDKNQYQRDYFYRRYTVQGREYLCWDDHDEDMYLIGSRESQNINKTYSKFVLIIDRCRNANYCADDQDIQEFLHDKIFDI